MVRRLLCLTVLFLGLVSPSFGPLGPVHGSAQAAEFLPAESLRMLLDQNPSLTFEGVPLPVAALSRFYAARADAPAWTFSALDHRAEWDTFLERTRLVARAHGLPATGRLRVLLNALATTTIEDPARRDIAVTALTLTLIQALRGENLSLMTVYPDWPFHRESLDAPLALAAAIKARQDLATFLTAQAPQTDDYRLLMSALDAYRLKEPWVLLPPGPKLEPGAIDASVPLVWTRLQAEDPTAVAPSGLDVNPHLYDVTLREAVRRYQERHGLEPDGVLGAKTREDMNIPLAARLDQIIANLERLRHFTDPLPARRAVVNIAASTLTVFDANGLRYRGPVVVGRTDRPTPFVQSAIHAVIFNPAWHIPPKLAREDVLPKLRKNPRYLEKESIEIVGREDDPYGLNVDWTRVPKRAFPFTLRQTPGDGNSLGRIKFVFENSFSVYLHGTPHQELFVKSARFFSSGCVRVRDPDVFAEILLNPNGTTWDDAKIRQAVDDATTRWVPLKKPLPLFITYATVFPNTDGTIAFLPDIYGYDRHLLEAFLPAEDT